MTKTLKLYAIIDDKNLKTLHHQKNPYIYRLSTMEVMQLLSTDIKPSDSML
jgi:hypothetical protein